MTDLTCALQKIDDPHVAEELLPLLYADLRRRAGAQMACEASSHTLQPTALVHEAWLRLARDGSRLWQNRAHFFGAAAEAMRRILVESARRKARLKRGGDFLRVDLAGEEVAAVAPDEKLLLIDDALQRLRAADPEKAQVVVLKFFGGLTNEQAAASLGVTERTIERHWAYAKAWLFRSIQTNP